jgi:hypothetical protein
VLGDEGAGTKSALTGGYHLAFWVAAGLVVVSVAIALLVLQPVATDVDDADDARDDVREAVAAGVSPS